ncbi:CRTAC1 family protein [Cognatishimia sp.]|uniref:CRTAC1 family protein n=1 Tax=Cognatishimia sp. TaxID=2211648 RepID=UPI003516B5A3|nr:CRTAC1 family protein [Cognatishimia sp.]
MVTKVLAVGLCGVSTLAWADPFVPEMTRINVPTHVYAGGWEHFVGGGVASFDCNSDSYPDLYVAGGENPAKLMINNGAFGFTAQTPAELSLDGLTGAYPIDIDSDGITDLAILRVGEDMILKGKGNCQFELFADLGFTSSDHWTTAFSATWEGDNALPTMVFGTYVDRADPKGPFETCDASLLYRPEGGRYGDPIKLEPGFCTLSMLFTDWARTGRADLRVSNDRHYYVKGGQEQLWAMEDTPRLYGEEDGWRPYQLWGMGIASRDITGDGFADVYLTSMGDQKLQFFEAGSGPAYKDATFQRGTTAHRPYTGGDGRPSTGWHAGFGDFNNDGLDDIFVAKGNVEQMPVAAMKDPNNLLLQTSDGDFVEMGEAAGIATYDRSRGGALVDLDLDGNLDLVVVNRRADLEVYRNAGSDGHWLSVSLTQDGANRNAVGAFIEIATNMRVQTREITLGGGHASGVLAPEHFGLGQAEAAKLRVIWPDGSTGAWQDVTANTRVTITR